MGFSYLGRGVALHGCSSKVQRLLLTLEEGYLLMAAPPDLGGAAPLGPPAPAQPPLLGGGVAPLGRPPDLGGGVAPLCRPPDLGGGVAPLCRPPDLGGGVAPLGRRPWPRTRSSSSQTELLLCRSLALFVATPDLGRGSSQPRFFAVRLCRLKNSRGYDEVTGKILVDSLGTEVKLWKR